LTTTYIAVHATLRIDASFEAKPGLQRCLAACDGATRRGWAGSARAGETAPQRASPRVLAASIAVASYNAGLDLCRERSWKVIEEPLERRSRLLAEGMDIKEWRGGRVR